MRTTYSVNHEEELSDLQSASIFDLDLPAVERVENVSRATFDQQIRSAGRPVVLSGLVESWPVVASAKASLEQLVQGLKQFDVGATVPTFIAPPAVSGRYFYSNDMRRFNFETREAPFRSVLDKLLEQRSDPDAMGIYAGASPTAQTLPGFAEHHPMPLVARMLSPRFGSETLPRSRRISTYRKTLPAWCQACAGSSSSRLSRLKTSISGRSITTWPDSPPAWSISRTLIWRNFRNSKRP